jgi:hypothetical protein
MDAQNSVAVADPLKRPHQELDGSSNGGVAVSKESDPAAKRIKLEDGETKTQPLQNIPQAKTHVPPQSAVPQKAAVKQEDTTSITTSQTSAKAPMSDGATAGVSGVAKAGDVSVSQLKPAASASLPQTLPQSTLQSTAKPQTTSVSVVKRIPTAPLAPAPIRVVTAPTNSSHVPQNEAPPPLKASTFHHLHRKYGPELDYMLVEFKKLERQLLGAPIHQQQNPPKAEPKGSRERREKLHGFILHLEDTVRQIEEGCAMEKSEEGIAHQIVDDVLLMNTDQKQPLAEEEKKSSDVSLEQPTTSPQPNAQITPSDDNKTPGSMEGPAKKFTAAEASLSALPPEKEREESVQRLEEHILANLLPVKVRLTKQLAAQKGATRNPLTAPVRAGAPATSAGGTIAEAVEAKRKAQEEELLKKQLQQRHSSGSQYGKPIGAAGSSLTARLHGGVLGNAAAGATATGSSPNKRPILYAGVAPGSTQVPSSINAVSGAHPDMIGKDATKAVALAEEERRRLKTLEENAARVALGVATKPPPPGSALDHRKPAALPTPLAKQPEGPATLAARARAVALAAANSGGPTSKISRPNQQFPPRSLQQHHLRKGPPLAAAANAAIAHSKAAHMYAKPAATYHSFPIPAMPPKPKKPHVKPNFDDPTLTPEQKFELRMKEARWRQRKRRRERRRKQLEGYYQAAGAYHAVPVQQQPPAPAPSLSPPQGTQPERVISTAVAPTASLKPNLPPALPPPPPPAPTVPVPTPPPPVAQAPRPKQNTVYGPRPVEYVCAVCNEAYMSTCEFNPWWALTSHDCPKCGKPQIPKLDISIPSNEIDYHPALLSQEDNIKGHSSSVSASASASAPVASISQVTQPMQFVPRPPSHLKKNFSLSDSEVSFTDESDGEGGGGKYDESSEEEDTNYDNDMDSVTREERAEKEEFGFEYKGETLSEDQSKRLLVLIEHASICPGR